MCTPGDIYTPMNVVLAIPDLHWMAAIKSKFSKKTKENNTDGG